MKIRTLTTAALLSASALAADPLAPINPADYQAPIRVACVGDSITQGSGLGKGQAYPAQLQVMLGDGWKVGNFGVSGRTLLKKGDYPYWREKAYQQALGFAPDVVIIMLGTNDTKPQNWKFEAEFVADYTELVKSFQTLASKPRIYVCRPCPAPDPGNFGINDKNVKEEIPRIDKLAKELDLGVIDMYRALADKLELLPDRVHPNAQGAGEMAKTAFKVLTGKPVPASK
ncbi:MAG TPA: GDSL-type esterase/lipase family protein [Luteolibacter sp.]